MDEMAKEWLYSVTVILGILLFNFRLIEKWDSKMTMGRKGRCLLLGCSLFGAQVAAGTGRHWFCVSVILGCLLTACVTDLLYYKVPNFLWWISGMAAGCMILSLWSTAYQSWEFYEGLGGLFIFILLQLFVFSKMYGKADGYAFSVCAGAEFGLGMHIFEFLMHMMVAYIILFIIQICRKNLAKSGNLKVPVAFIPYITASFLIFLHKYAI